MEVRIFESYRVENREDWKLLECRFKPTPEGRFPRNWRSWCAHSRRAGHSIALAAYGVSKPLFNTLGLEGPGGALFGVYDRPGLVREIINRFSSLYFACAEKALQEARVDFVVITDELAGIDGLLFSPDTMRELFLAPLAELAGLIRSRGIDTVLLYQRGNLNVPN